MFDKSKFAQILKNINETYINQRDFSKKSEINRTYLSQYMNKQLDNPPKPEILKRLANSSHGITNYNELMSICGYISNIEDKKHVMAQTQSDYLELRKYILENNNFSSSEISEFKKILSIPDNLKYEEKLDIFLRTLDNKKKEIALNMVKDSMNYIKSISYVEYYNSNNKYYMCPVYGQISAGQPNWVEECIEGKLPIDPELMGIINPEEHYFLRVNGESMNKVVKNGAFALIHKQDMVENGEIAVVLVNGDNATLKRFSKEGNIIVLTPESTDSSIKQQIYTKDVQVKIIGKYVGKMEINK